MNRLKWILTIAVVTLIEAVVLMSWAESPGEIEAWQKAMTPGPQHAELAEQAGEWSYSVTMWQEPGAEPTTLNGVALKRMIMGGRFLEEELSGEFMGRPFRGFGITGYDNVTKELVGIWLDNAGTGIGVYTGSEDRNGVHSYTSTTHDPASGKPLRMRSVGRTIDHDHHTFESYVTMPDGSEHLHMRVEYTRVGA